jgi:integrase/recombinase XerD
MPSVFRRSKTKPLPAGAKVVERKGGPVAEWLDARGNRRSAPLTEDRAGIRIEAASWTVQYVDEHGHPQRLAGGRDYDAAMQLGREYERRAMQRREGLIDPAQERHAKAARQPIADHAAAYVAFLAAGERTAKHVQATERYLAAIFARCGMERLSDLRAPAVLSAVAAIRQGVPLGEKKQRPASLSTCNAVLRAMKGFSRWLQRQRLTAEDALLGLEMFNAATDRRHIRRELSAAEVQRLLDVAERRTLPENGAPGPTRAMCYRVAAATGFRASELRSLTRESFDLEASPPTCTVEAAYSKRRRRDVQPLPEALVEPLRAWLSGFEPGRRVFEGIALDTARMLRADLAAARAEWLDEAGSEAERQERERADFLLYADHRGHVSDFHSLRVLYISRVVAGGASVKVAQSLARHSTPELTFNVYARTGLHDVAGAVEGLGDLLSPKQPQPEAQRMRATGTDGRASPGRSGVHTDVHTRSARAGSERHSEAASVPFGPPGPRRLDERQSPEKRGVIKAEGTGFEPATDFSASDFESDR